MDQAVTIDRELLVRPAAQSTTLGHALNLLAGADARFRESFGRSDLVWSLIGFFAHGRLLATGIGAVGIAPPLWAGDNSFTVKQIARAQKLGAVGELNLRYIAQDGEPLHVDIEDLVVGATLEQLRRADRRWGVAGGPSKYRAIRAALVGGWLNMLVTDSTTAQMAACSSRLTGPQPLRRSRTGRRSLQASTN